MTLTPVAPTLASDLVDFGLLLTFIVIVFGFVWIAHSLGAWVLDRPERGDRVPRFEVVPLDPEILERVYGGKSDYHGCRRRGGWCIHPECASE